MSDSVAFHAQLAAIIDVLAKSAVAEISKLVDDGYALLRLEVSQSHKQNEVLKRRLRMMEHRVARGLIQVERAGLQDNLVNNRTGVQIFGRSKKMTEGCFLTEEGLLGKGMNITHWSDGEPPAGHEGCTPGQPVTSRVRPAEVEKTKPKLSLVKSEKSEEDPRHGETLTEPKSSGEIFPPGAVEWRAGSREKRPVQETQNKPANLTEELTEQHRTRRAVWEVSGLESALKAEGESECVEMPQHRGTEHRAEVLNRLDSEFVMFERPGQLGSYCTQENVEAGGQNPSEMTSELHLDHVTKEAAGKSLSSLASQDRKTDIVIMDSVPVKMEDTVQIQSFWNTESHSGAFEMQWRGSGDERTTSICTPYTEVIVPENLALPHTDQPDVDGCVSYENNLFPSKSPMTTGAIGTRKERYVCKYCGKSCTRASDLKVHQRVHTGEKPFSCSQCGKRFSQSCSLKKHKVIHTGEKPFSCLQCGKQFSDSSNLSKHKSIHTGDRPYSCSQCGKKFKQPCYLKTHMRIHTGDKSFICAYCGKVFASKYSLKLHQVKNHLAPYSVQ